mgnify:CR=1 FL=1
MGCTAAIQARQIIDNLGKAAIMQIPYQDVPGLLSEAWGSERPRKRKLAYLIQKQREGQYVLLTITMAPDATKELERKIRFLEPVMRHMLTVV